MKITNSLELTPHADQLWKKFQKLWQQLAKVVNGNIAFGYLAGPAWQNATTNAPVACVNISGSLVSLKAELTAANIAITFKHGLGRVPQGAVIISCLNDAANGGNTIYSTQADLASWTTSQMTLRFTTTNWVLLLVI